MRTRRQRFALATMAAAGVSSLALLGAATASAAPTVTEVASHLNAPAHLAFGPGGHLFFAESGSGNTYRCFEAADPEGAQARYCPGGDGEVDEVQANGSVDDVFGEIGNLQNVSTGTVTGVNAVTFHDGHLVVLEGVDQVNLSDDTPYAVRYPMGALREQGTGEIPYTGIVHGRKTTLYRPVPDFFRGADLAGFAQSHPQSPSTVGGPPGYPLTSSDPSDVVPYDGGWAVTDAGADDVLQVSTTGHVSVIARLPTQPENAPADALYPGSAAQAVNSQAAPSALAVGPDGALYVAVTRSVPGLVGSAEIDRVTPGQTPTPVVTGLTSVSDLAFTHSGQLLILEADGGTPGTPGALLSADVDPTSSVTATDLDIPGLVDADGLAISAAGNVFISNDSIGDDTGQVLKVSGLLN